MPFKIKEVVEVAGLSLLLRLLRDSTSFRLAISLNCQNSNVSIVIQTHLAAKEVGQTTASGVSLIMVALFFLTIIHTKP